MVEEVKRQVSNLLSTDQSGHDIKHVERVLKMSLEFALKEGADQDIVALIALLHDVDDYKLFGIENAQNLTNAKNILNQCFVDEIVQEKVLNAIKTIGYSKRLKGIKPMTIEGMVVSDADMCDAMGATGILRSYQYNLVHNHVFFDKDIFPKLNMSASQYMNNKEGTVVTHMFEKLLKLKDFMLTDSGKKEALERHGIMVSFLYHYFKEVDALDWLSFLEPYLKKED